MNRFGRILIVGALGQVGRELQRSFAGSGDILCYDRDEVDIANPDQVREMIRATAPDLILNAAAYTAVDRAETEKELATAINATAPRVLGEEARRRDILLVHYSTDYVFDGSKNSPWQETDCPNPLNHYGASKLAGEQALEQVGGKYLIFRTSWVYGPHGNNFLLTILRLGRERDRLTIVDDQYGGPTTSTALAEATRSVVNAVVSGAHGNVEQWAGLYHLTCAGSTSWCGFTREIFSRAGELLGTRIPQVLPIPTEAYPTPATRPRNSVLSNEKLRDRFGVQMPEWRVELARTIQRLQSEKS